MSCSVFEKHGVCFWGGDFLYYRIVNAIFSASIRMSAQHYKYTNDCNDRSLPHCSIKLFITNNLAHKGSEIYSFLSTNRAGQGK